MKVDVLIAADLALVRYGVRCVLTSEDPPPTCSECRLEELAASVEAVAPGLLVLCPGAADTHLLADVRALRRTWPSLPLLMVVPDGFAADLKDALYAGVRGFVEEAAAEHQLPRAVRRLRDGHSFVGTGLMERLVYLIATDAPAPGGASLSERELQVLRLSGQGYRPRLIADALRLSAKTVHTHRENLKRKLRVDSTAELDQFAVRWLRGEVTF